MLDMTSNLTTCPVCFGQGETLDGINPAPLLCRNCGGNGSVPIDSVLTTAVISDKLKHSGTSENDKIRD